MASVMLRWPPDLHAAARIAAAAEKLSVHAFILAAVRERILRAAASDRHGPVAAHLGQALKASGNEALMRQFVADRIDPVDHPGGDRP